MGRRRGGASKGLEHRPSPFSNIRSRWGSPLARKQESPSRGSGLKDSIFFPPGPVMLDCLSCHATRTSHRRASCGRSPIRNPQRLVSAMPRAGTSPRRKWPGDRLRLQLEMPYGGRHDLSRDVRMCGRCHRLPEMVPPGSIRPESWMLVRFPFVGRCNGLLDESSGETGCSTRHDPHTWASTHWVTYDGVCLDCHSDSRLRCAP